MPTPIAQDDNANGTEDTNLTGNVLTDNGNGPDSDPENDLLKVTAAVIATAHGNVEITEDGSFTYTPNTDYHGSDSFEYTLEDNEGNTDIGQVNITLGAVNDAPVAQDDFLTPVEDTPFTANVLVDNGSGADSDVDGDTLAVLATTLTTVKGGTVVIEADGSFTYTPAQDFSGRDSFRYTLVDGNGGTDDARVILQVADVADNWRGTEGDDVHTGGYLNDTLAGRGGNDVLIGGAGWDNLWGNEGDDTLYGGKGADWMKGGNGADKFVLDGINDNRVDTIADLRLNKGDSIQIRDILDFDPLVDAITDFVSIVQNGADSVLSVDADGLANGVNFTTVASIIGITGLNVQQMYDDGDLTFSQAIV